MKTSKLTSGLLVAFALLWTVVSPFMPALYGTDERAARAEQQGVQRRDSSRDVRNMPGGPYQHKVLSASSREGLIWTRDPGVRLEHASVPCAVADGNRILLYYVDANRGPAQPESVGCAVSTDGINFVKQPFALEGLPMKKAVDPSVVRDRDGMFHLYYLASSSPGDPASDERPHQIHLAFSDDGVHFRNAGLAFQYPRLVDPDVFYFKDDWFMYVFAGGDTVVAKSADGRTFTYQQALALRGFGTVAPVNLEDGRLRLYAFEQHKPASNAVRSFISTNGFDWVIEEGTRLTAAKNEQITDPFVIRWKDGWKMYFKVEQRRADRNVRKLRPADFKGRPSWDQQGGY